MKGLILTYLIAYSAIFASLRYPLYGLYVFIGLGIVRPQDIFGFAGDIRNLSLYVGVAVVVGWVINGMGNWKFGRARASMTAFLAFFLWFVISAFLALNTTRSWDSFFDFMKLCIPLLAGVTLVNEEKERRALLWVIVLCQGYVGFEQNLNYLVKGFNTAQEGFGGMDNNFFGLALVTTLGPALALVLVSRTWINRGLAAISTLFILHTILLTFSRGAMVGMVAVGIVMFILMPKKPINIAALIIVTAIAARLTGPQLLARYGTIFGSSGGAREASAESRVDLWKDCIKVIEEYPIFGVGPANWRTIAASYGWPSGKSAHSVWMETAAEVGLPGVFALFLFFAITALKLAPLARQKITDENRFEVGASLGIVLGITGFVVAGQFVSAPALEIPYYVSLMGLAILKSHTSARQAQAYGAANRTWQPAATLRPAAATAMPAGAGFRPAQTPRFFR